jgi:3-oxoacyl-[acyl-carrier protein] reductase
MDLGLRGRVAFVAAASQGLGRAIAEELAREGARVAVCARTERIHEVARAIGEAHGVETFAVVADISVPADVTRAAAAVLARFGQVDVLVTNAGGPPPGPFESHA